MARKLSHWLEYHRHTLFCSVLLFFIFSSSISGEYLRAFGTRPNKSAGPQRVSIVNSGPSHSDSAATTDFTALKKLEFYLGNWSGSGVLVKENATYLVEASFSLEASGHLLMNHNQFRFLPGTQFSKGYVIDEIGIFGWFVDRKQIVATWFSSENSSAYYLGKPANAESTFVFTSFDSTQQRSFQQLDTDSYRMIDYRRTPDGTYQRRGVANLRRKK